MPRNRHTPEQIIGKLREAEVGLARGQTTNHSMQWPDAVAPAGTRRADGEAQRPPAAGKGGNAMRPSGS